MKREVSTQQAACLLLSAVLGSALFLSGTLSAARAQTAARAIPPTVASMQLPVQVPGLSTISDGTEIQVRLAAPVKIKEVKIGDDVHFVLYHDHFYRNFLLARADEPVEAKVVDAQKALGQPGV